MRLMGNLSTTGPIEGAIQLKVRSRFAFNTSILHTFVLAQYKGSLLATKFFVTKFAVNFKS